MSHFKFSQGANNQLKQIWLLILIFIMTSQALASLPDLIIISTSLEETGCNTYKVCYQMRNPTDVSVSAVVENFIYINGVHMFTEPYIFPLLSNTTYFSCGTYELSGPGCSQAHTVQVCADGNNEQAETIESNNCGTVVPFPPTGPLIAMSKAYLNFGKTSESESLTIWNDEPCCQLDYIVEVITGDAYFDITPLSGSSTDDTDLNHHQITVDRSMIPRGETVEGLLRISGNAGNSPVDFQLTAGRYLADLNADGLVNIPDLLLLISPWLANDTAVDTGPIAEPDGFINYFDFYIFDQEWLAGY